jgi:hypothetical protein
LVGAYIQRRTGLCAPNLSVCLVSTVLAAAQVTPFFRTHVIDSRPPSEMFYSLSDMSCDWTKQGAREETRGQGEDQLAPAPSPIALLIPPPSWDMMSAGGRVVRVAVRGSRLRAATFIFRVYSTTCIDSVNDLRIASTATVVREGQLLFRRWISRRGRRGWGGRGLHCVSLDFVNHMFGDPFRAVFAVQPHYHRLRLQNLPRATEVVPVRCEAQY